VGSTALVQEPFFMMSSSLLPAAYLWPEIRARYSDSTILFTARVLVLRERCVGILEGLTTPCTIARAIISAMNSSFKKTTSYD
jgi:hypothetical protein